MFVVNINDNDDNNDDQDNDQLMLDTPPATTPTTPRYQSQRENVQGITTKKKLKQVK